MNGSGDLPGTKDPTGGEKDEAGSGVGGRRQRTGVPPLPQAMWGSAGRGVPYPR